MTNTEHRKKSYYQDEFIVRQYDKSRFGSPSGRWVKCVEENAIEEIIDNYKLSSYDAVLDLPVGTGRMFGLFQGKFKQVYGADFSQEMINYAKSCYGYIPVRCDAFNIPFSSASLDLIVSSRFVPHIKDLDGLLEEFNRVLKPGGIVIFDSYNWTPRAIFPFLQQRLGGEMFLHKKKDIEKISSSLNMKVVFTLDRFILPPYVYQFLPLALVRAIEGAFSPLKLIPRVRTYYALQKQ